MPRPRVTLIIPTHRPRRRVLDDVLTAAFAQLTPDDEAVVVENGTNTLADLRRPGLEVRFESRPGSAFARQHGVAHSRGAVIWFLDDDTIPAPGHLAAGLARLDTMPGLGIVGGGVTVVDEDQRPPASAFARALFGERSLGPEFLVSAPGEPAVPHFMPFSAGALFCRDVATAHFAALDPRFPGRVGAGGVDGCEDIEMVAAALRAGWQVAFEPAMHVRHVIDPQRLTFAYLARLSFGSARSYGRFLVKYGNERPITRGGLVLRALRGVGVAPPVGREGLLRYLQYLGRAAGRIRRER